MLFRDIFAVTSELGLPVAEMQIWALSAWVVKSKKINILVRWGFGDMYDNHGAKAVALPRAAECVQI